jgi:alkylhydroperoxidase/carboxymuconolactone decarboxylase family protein YurZ
MREALDMLNSPHSDLWSSFYASTTKGASLDERTMTLIGLAAAIAVDCEPCAEHYLTRCKEKGISDPEIADVLAKVMAVSAGKNKIKFSRVIDRTRRP